VNTLPKVGSSGVVSNDELHNDSQDDSKTADEQLGRRFTTRHYQIFTRLSVAHQQHQERRQRIHVLVPGGSDGATLRQLVSSLHHAARAHMHQMMQVLRVNDGGQLWIGAPNRAQQCQARLRILALRLKERMNPLRKEGCHLFAELGANGLLRQMLLLHLL